MSTAALQRPASTLDGDVQELLETSKSIIPTQEDLKHVHADRLGGQKLFGFTFGNQDKAKDEKAFSNLKRHIDYIDHVVADTNRIRAWCKKEGIPIIAIVPSKVFLDLCRDFRLGIFVPDSKGRVEVSTGVLQKIGNEAANKVSRYMGFFMIEKSHQRVMYEESVAAYEAVKSFVRETDRYDLIQVLFPAENQKHHAHRVMGPCIELNFPISDAHFEMSFRMCVKANVQPIVIVNPRDVDIDDFLAQYLKDSKKEIARARYRPSRFWFKKKKKNKEVPNVASSSSKPTPLLAIAYGSVHVLIAQHGEWLIGPEVIKQAIRENFRI